ncbi:LacI family DNA-binding transcriptional regulator [Agromyces seonyuensis]|uniref:LacI family DNA-binding transcriptional regulator n=1 Tax=Agromyces seonyuensis TaxID=2662446 RepID=A0A6I4NX13_9MICO|nr:LacI family DNA-binding transcriptional regulator [Agromyces seonyuensis]MWB97632.1 LacI family DNA-binding transcriptional regulator [Agromyces seonyuensis]
MPELDGGRQPSIRDVARLAGVSHQTVSRVLNDHPSIRPETKQRVIDAMGELKYRPNRAARTLVTSRSRTIGVLLATRGEYGPTSSIAAIEDAAREQGYWVTTANLPATTPEAIAEAVAHLREQDIEGLIVIAPQVRTFDVLAELALGVPVVSLQSAAGALRTEIADDQVTGARLATEHLISLGHREIVHLAGPRDWIEAESRMRGFLDAVNDADLMTHPPFLGDWTADFGYYAARELARRRDFTAVFAANDLMAIGLMHGFRDMGLDVPRAVSIVGFDDIPVARHVWPPLTTVHQDFRGAGRRTIALLLAEMGVDTGYADAPVAAHLEVRASSAPPIGAQVG